MFETINEPVAVLAGFSHKNGQVRVLPYLLDWRNQRYKLDVMGLHHPAKRGKKFLHVFEFTSGSTKFKLELDTETLSWCLAEVYHDY
ncbi:MAG TPA: hypothetical protein VMR75_02245 [Candidatus Saccharimonadales bacterium]|nr:hypothetical protein [Candidatus Saccharimonadales bacterium]